MTRQHAAIDGLASKELKFEDALMAWVWGVILWINKHCFGAMCAIYQRNSNHLKCVAATSNVSHPGIWPKSTYESTKVVCEKSVGFFCGA